jgi:F0F1-type ATP synthase assembly protein I
MNTTFFNLTFVFVAAGLIDWFASGSPWVLIVGLIALGILAKFFHNRTPPHNSLRASPTRPGHVHGRK